LRERAQRIYEKYGNVMLETKGMTKAGIERKATCRALFSKLLYLSGVLPVKPCSPEMLRTSINLSDIPLQYESQVGIVHGVR
jgi:hypothetical protein